MGGDRDSGQSPEKNNRPTLTIINKPMTSLLLKSVAVLAVVGLVAASPTFASGSDSKAEHRIETKEDVVMEDGVEVLRKVTKERIRNEDGSETRVETRKETSVDTGQVTRFEVREETRDDDEDGRRVRIETRRENPLALAGVAMEDAEFEIRKEVRDDQGTDVRIRVKVDENDDDDGLVKLEIRKETEDEDGFEREVRIEKEVSGESGTLFEAAHAFLMAHFPGLLGMMTSGM